MVLGGKALKVGKVPFYCHGLIAIKVAIMSLENPALCASTAGFSRAGYLLRRVTGDLKDRANTSCTGAARYLMGTCSEAPVRLELIRPQPLLRYAGALKIPGCVSPKLLGGQ